MGDLIAIFGNILLFALVFGMSATVDVRCMATQLRNYRAIFTGVFCQFAVLPFLGFMVVRLMELDHSVGITLLVVTSSPGGSYSNWWCSLFNGDLALSVSMTAISTILSVIMLPVNLMWYTSFSYEADVIHNLDWVSLFIALGIVIIAISLGLLCSAKIQSIKFNRVANQVGNLAGLCLILFSATMTNTGSSDTKIWSRDWSFYVAVIIPIAGGLILSNVISSSLRLQPPERVTVAIECVYQNVGIATSLCLSMFDGNDLNEAMGVPFFYGVVEAVLVGAYCVFAWKAGWTKAPSNAPLLKVLLVSYEVAEMERSDLDNVEVSVSDSDEPDPETMNGSSMTTYFNMAWLDPSIPVHSGAVKKHQSEVP